MEEISLCIWYLPNLSENLGACTSFVNFNANRIMFFKFSTCLYIVELIV